MVEIRNCYFQYTEWIFKLYYIILTLVACISKPVKKMWDYWMQDLKSLTSYSPHSTKYNMLRNCDKEDTKFTFYLFWWLCFQSFSGSTDLYVILCTKNKFYTKMWCDLSQGHLSCLCYFYMMSSAFNTITSQFFWKRHLCRNSEN